ncbi:MAG: replication factor C large subunit [Candidatus Hermodarchaeia archaeon]|jgi:replication factor C large subunit
MKDQPWVVKYKPQRIKDLAGNKTAISVITEWLKTWPKGIKRNQRALMLFGPAGVGKTVALYTIANELDYEIFEINASVKRSKKMMNELLKISTKTGTLTGKRGRIVLIDELGGLSGKSDRGAASAIKDQIQETQVPIILITSDISNSKIRPLRKICTYIEFEPITVEEITKKLRTICTKESINFEDTALDTLASHTRGDLRAAINDLQSLVETGSDITNQRVNALLRTRDQKIDISEALERIFFAETWKEAVFAANQTDAYPDELIRWVSHNLPAVFPDLAQQERALALLSRASIFNRRITRTQNWRLLPYSKELMSLTASIVGGKPTSHRPKYNFPEWIRQMGFSRGLRQKRILIGQSLSPIVHLSTKKAYREYKIVLKALIREPELREEIEKDLELSEELIQFIAKD